MQKEMNSKNVMEKSITCEDEAYLNKLVSIRAQVIEALNTEKKLKRQIDKFTAEYNNLKPINVLATQKYIELSKRRYTIEYIEEMINKSTELYIERNLIEIKCRILEEGYSYDLIEALITYDNLLIETISNSVNTENPNISNENKEKKYEKSFFRKAYLGLIGGIFNEDD